MAGIKISELPEASCVGGNELVAIVQDSCTKFVAASAIGATGDSTITSVIAGCGLQGGGSFGAVTINLDANCMNKYEGTTTVVRSTSACWDGAYTTVQASSASWESAYAASTSLASCPGLNCVGTVLACDLTGFTNCTGTIEGVTTESYLTGGGSGGCVTIGIDAACVASWDTGGSGGVVAGTACRVSRYNSSGNNIEDSNILDSSSLLTIDVDTAISGDLSATNVNIGTSNRLGQASGGEILSGGNNFVVGGDTNTVIEVATETSHSGTIGGTRNIINGGCNNVIIGGETNCLCENTTDASFTSMAIVGSLSSCINGECSGIYSAANVNVCGKNSVVIGGYDHTTECGCAYIFGGVCNSVGGQFSTAVGGCRNIAGAFLNDYATTVGGTCICATGVRSAAIGGLSNTAAGDNSVVMGCCNVVNDNAHESVIAGGKCNQIGGADCYSFIGGGFGNCVAEDCSAIVGGQDLCTTECYSFLGGGASNCICLAGGYGAIIGGQFNAVKHDKSAIVGGTSITSVSGCMLHAKTLWLDACGLPGSDPGVPGVVWNDSGTLKISV